MRHANSTRNVTFLCYKMKNKNHTDIFRVRKNMCIVELKVPLINRPSCNYDHGVCHLSGNL
jgi:hypothetical protein